MRWWRRRRSWGEGVGSVRPIRGRRESKPRLKAGAWHHQGPGLDPGPRRTERAIPFFTYILASRPHGALYTGSANDLRLRVEQHRAGGADGHTKRYGIHTLVWFEAHDTLHAALLRERQIKRWRRAWKDALIEELNPSWRDISDQIPL